MSSAVSAEIPHSKGRTRVEISGSFDWKGCTEMSRNLRGDLLHE
jgi:hypothetical protein